MLPRSTGSLWLGVALIAGLTAASSAVASTEATAPMAPTAPTAQSIAVDPLAHDIFKELIEINTTDTPAGSVTAAAEAVRKRLLDAGFPASDLALLGPNDRKKNLIVRFHGTGQHKPILLIGHLDVVEAKRGDWTTDPFQFVEKDGFFYGRGTLDMKSGDAIMTTTLIRLRKENFHPSRDIILALTADEETGSANGVDWLLHKHRDLVDAQYVINHDTQSVMSLHGKPQYFELDATEKVYADYQLTVVNSGGHSSLPVPDNAIYRLAAGLTRLAGYEFPFELNTVSRGYYETMSTIETGQRAADMRAILQATPDKEAIERLSRDPVDHSTLRTTCVATRLEGGHANNALPQKAEAVVNCRILPGHSAEEVRQDLLRVLADRKITLRYIDENGVVHDKGSLDKGFAPPPLNPEVMVPLQKLVAAMWPGLKVVPTMQVGASDAVYAEAAGLPTYAIAGIAVDRDDLRMHGRDERIGVQSFYAANEFFYRFIKALTAR